MNFFHQTAFLDINISIAIFPSSHDFDIYNSNFEHFCTSIVNFAFHGRFFDIFLGSRKNCGD